MARQEFRTIFTRNGWDVAEAGDAAEALRALEDSPPDWVVIDLSLADGEGPRLLKAIRARPLPVRVAVCVSQGDSDRLAEVMVLRPDIALVKPVDVAALFQACQFLQAVPAPRHVQSSHSTS